MANLAYITQKRQDKLIPFLKKNQVLLVYYSGTDHFPIHSNEHHLTTITVQNNFYQISVFYVTPPPPL